ncbi:PREDICTED: probable N-acetyltransferase 16 [Branchiostoma belcheri]|uniref:Probable N-acetyltransferase 16 n=1 Tax=Branchiostoma belcheri TaxID=7741 RepID=A0A6P5AL98_BRABE|nr:PREDICTED: probable N-acetyltransferase 16 [Branchiostoma belcheri]
MANQNSLHLTYREATHSDYDAVMNMASVDTFRDGFDYLPAKFHQWVDDPDVIMFVAEANDKVVGLYVSIITDGGANVLSKTIRIAPELQGKKMQSKMAAELDTTLRHTHPQLWKLEVHALSDVKRLYLTKVFPNKKDICFIDVMFFQGMSNEVLDSLETKDVLPSHPQPPVVPYQPSDMARLARPEFSQQILVDNTIFVDWDPYQLSASNLRLFSKQSATILVDTSEPTAKSLSFGGSYMTPRGRLYHVDVHCRDVALCQAHIKHHVGRACHEYEGMITFCVMLIDPCLKATSKTFCVERLGLVHLPHDHRYLYFKYQNPELDPSQSRL